jgi:hypothetical protein
MSMFIYVQMLPLHIHALFFHLAPCLHFSEGRHFDLVKFKFTQMHVHLYENELCVWFTYRVKNREEHLFCSKNANIRCISVEKSH